MDACYLSRICPPYEPAPALQSPRVFVVLVAMGLAWRPARRLALGTSLVLTFCLAALQDSRALADPCDACPPACRPMDQVWEFSTRNIPCSCLPDDWKHDLQVFQHGDAGWARRDVPDFLAEVQDPVRTIFYVHGNRVSQSEARCRGLAVYRALTQHAEDDAPLRFVIWSWSADIIRGRFVYDFRVKACRTEPSSYVLAWLLPQMNPDTNIGLVGYSLGARLITGALQIEAGGELAGTPPLPPPQRGAPPVRVVLIAAAMHDDWLLPDCYHGLALEEVDQMLVFTNPCDRALRHYGVLEKCARPTALGLCGLACPEELGELQTNYDEIQVTEQLGTSHDLCSYLSDAYLTGLMWAHLAHHETATDTPELVPH